ncbi:hypothetical protein GUJ93_ZPchr0016g2579 [Zizania palustris]|uniref:Uncharacterized protein n=1 Tax=Zizania palustris TaxID=103762 RepID=A0A8J5TDJ9_ZIZPA|nr:hypothetical protein GUJ93_ZPchr0016g2579 [Zizania palustris]
MERLLAPDARWRLAAGPRARQRRPVLNTSPYAGLRRCQLAFGPENISMIISDFDLSRELFCYLTNSRRTRPGRMSIRPLCATTGVFRNCSEYMTTPCPDNGRKLSALAPGDAESHIRISKGS